MAELVAAACAAPYFRPYTASDVVGTEICGAVKNVIALAVGMAEGLGMGDNSKASIITRGLAETMRLGTALGGDAVTFAGLAGVGDLIATCMSPLSRNHSFGVRLGQGMAVSEVVAVTKQTAEGVKSCTSILDLARNNGVDVPIIEQVDAMIQHDRTAPEVVAALLSRPRKAETACPARVLCSRRAAQARSRAWLRSRQRSSTSSMPTESRIRFSGTLTGSLGMRRRRSSWLSTPPRLVECTHTRVAAQTRSAPSSPPATSMATMPPHPGWRTRSTRGCSRSRAASSRALAWARSTRRCRVRSPRSASQTSIGPAIAPCSVRWVTSRCVVRAAGIRGGCDHGAEQHVAVAGEVLGHRVHDDVGAELERSLQQRRREGVVHDREHAALAGRRQQGRQVGDLEQRVGRRLEPEQVGAVEGREHRAGVGDVDPAHGGRPLGLAGAERGDDAVVGRVGGDDGAAVGEQRQGSRHGRHPRRQHEGVAALEVAERGLEGGPRRVARAGVDHVTVGVVGRGEHERGADLTARHDVLAAERDDAGGGGEPVGIRAGRCLGHARQGMR